MARKREIIKLNSEDELLQILIEDWEIYKENDGKRSSINSDFEIIESKDEYTDLEKAYSKMRVVVRRKSDGKYFVGEYTESPYNNEADDLTLTQVFPKKISKIIYQ